MPRLNKYGLPEIEKYTSEEGEMTFTESNSSGQRLIFYALILVLIIYFIYKFKK